LNIPFVYELTHTGQPSNNETITVGGIVLTAKTALSGGDKEFLIGGDAATTYANLVALLQNPLIDTAAAKGVTKNSADHLVLRKYSAKTSGTKVQLISKRGRWGTAPTETLTNATMGSTQLKFPMVTMYGAVEMAMPKGVDFNSGKNETGTIESFSSRVRYGIATPTNGLKKYAFVRAEA
jgi:hypothetical protein